ATRARREMQYSTLCMYHVREYNKSYNCFSGMKDDDVVAYQRSAATGHRPTWTMGVNYDGEARIPPTAAWSAPFSDPFGIFGGGREQPRAPSEPERRPLRNV